MAGNSSITDKFSKLPVLAKPFLYELYLAPCLKSFDVKGNETIHLEIVKKTNLLKLYSNGISIEKVSLKLADGKVLSDLKTEIDNKWTLLTIHLPQEVEPQKAQLDITFLSKLRTELEGFYRSPCKDIHGNDMLIASTQFESVYARKAFPCWDEPEYKAQFDVQLEVAKDLTALSNMNVVEEKETGTDTKLVKFARTPLMSTYLLAFALGNFEYVEGKSKIGCDVRVYCLPGKKAHCGYALEVATKSIDWYSDWYGIKMPLPKCDLIGIPEFAMGAMENWGLITFRETGILYDPARTSSIVKQTMTLIIGHEVGHFWFGNLVTMKWWSDLWLKEGFASFMEYVFTDAIYPKFNIWLSFVNMEVSSAMKLDSLRNSHPIEVPINNPNELDEIYDSITYAKSNSLIRMLFFYLGEPVFQKGLQIYLNKFQYSNAETQDLWNCLSEASGIDVTALMSSWTKQMGFPLVTVEERNLPGDKRELHLTQTRFLADGGMDENNPVWQVPISITTAADPSKPKTKILLTKQEDKFVVEGVKPNEWIKLNSNFTSLARIQYSPDMLKVLLEAVKNGQVDAVDRFEISNDLFALVSSLRIPASQFLDYLSVCANEDNLIVWESIDGGICEISNVLTQLDDGGKLNGQFNKFISKVIEPVAARYGWEPKPNEDMQTGRLRALLLSRLAKSGHQPTIDTALAKFKDYVEKNAELVPDLRGTIFSTVSRASDPKNIEQLQKIMKTCNFPEIERNCILALGQCGDRKLLEQIYQHGVTEKNIKNQDIVFLFMSSALSCNTTTLQVSWNFFKQNLPLLLEYFGSPSANLFQHCLKISSKKFCSKAMAEEIQDFCKKNMNEDALRTLDRPLKQIVESVMLNEALLKANAKNLEEYLQKAKF